MKGEWKDTYVTDQLSTGSDDNIPVELNVIIFIPVILLAIIRFNKPIILFEYLFNNCVCLLQILFLFCIETGSILNTIIYERNISLWTWVISFVLFICVTQVFYFHRKTL